MARSDPGSSRRDFGRAVAALALGPAVGHRVGQASGAARPAADGSPLAEFVRVLDPERRARLVLRADDPRRAMVQNHWAIVPEPIAALSAPQQDLALAVIRQVFTPEGFDRWTQQRHDDAGGWKHDHLAVIAAPDGSGPVEWIVSGRHLTLRGAADGSIAAGPLFWGHTATGPAALSHRPTSAARSLWAALESADRRAATVNAESARAADAGLPLGRVGKAGHDEARLLVATLTEPFRALVVPTAGGLGHESNALAGCRWQAFSPSGAPPVAWRIIGPGWRWSVHTEPHFHSWFEAS